jgi:hypothetical protein
LKPPNFRQGDAAVAGDKLSLRWPGFFCTGFLSPQPPGAVGAGPVRKIMKRNAGDESQPQIEVSESWPLFFGQRSWPRFLLPIFEFSKFLD